MSRAVGRRLWTVVQAWLVRHWTLQVCRERFRGSARITLEPHARPRPRFSIRRQRNPVHRVLGHRPTTWHAAPLPSRTRPSDNASRSGAFSNPGKRLPNPLRRVREHRETPEHAAASRPRTPQGDMTSWSLEINYTPQRQNRPFQRDPRHQQTAHPAVPSSSRSEHSDSACHSLQIETSPLQRTV